jgi:hypothetical protein
MTAQADQDVPGTVLLVDLAGAQSGGKHASDRSDIVLVPQPSADPEDPLNWSRKRKMWSLAMVSVYTMGVGIPGTLHYSVLADITNDTGIPTVDLGAHSVIHVGNSRDADILQSTETALCFSSVGAFPFVDEYLVGDFANNRAVRGDHSR